MVPLLPLRDGVRALPISSFRQSMPSFYMNAPDCICSPGRLPLGAFCAGRDDLEREALHDDRISIHAPRAGCDDRRRGDHARANISIHAPRAGCDRLLRGVSHAVSISIHAPRAGCDSARELDELIQAFQSTHPVRGATTVSKLCDYAEQISIHAPRAGCDAHGCVRGRRVVLFQSTHPVRGATPSVLMLIPDDIHFNPRTPCGVRPRLSP